ncbi:MAG: divergent polysaccharide deacetylase family protein, partial [Rickettsiaceae bacterium]|nr:divergent polysaccharide deacetylase family protein [Rickettsiaceae bacterium]
KVKMKDSNKLVLKKTLIFLSIFLGFTWFFILAYGLFVETPVATKLAISSGEMAKIDITKPIDNYILQEKKKKEELDNGIKEIITTSAGKDNAPNSAGVSTEQEQKKLGIQSSDQVPNNISANAPTDQKPSLANLASNQNDTKQGSVNTDKTPTLSEIAKQEQESKSNGPNQVQSGEEVAEDPKKAKEAFLALQKKNNEALENIVNQSESPANQTAQLAGSSEVVKKQETKNEQKPAATEKNPPAKIAILISNLGTNKILTDSALTLPKEFTLGFSSFTEALRPSFDEAIKSNREVMIYFPFQPKDYPLSVAGPFEILEKFTAEQNLETVKKILSLFPGIVGAYGNDREAFTSKKDQILPIVDYLGQNQLRLLVSRNIDPKESFFLDRAVIICDVVIDSSPTPESIKSALDKLVNIAKKKGYAVGFTNTYPVTLKILSGWVKTINQAEIKIVPITQIK